MALDEANSGLKLSDHAIFDARARWQQRIRFLRVGRGQHRRLAAKLASCEKGHRCKSEADPVCVTLFWQKLCRGLSDGLAGRAWTRASVVTCKPLVRYGALGAFDLPMAIDRLRKRLGLCSLRDRIIIGAIDISLTVKSRKIIGWQLHLDLLVEGKNGSELQKVIAAAFSPEPTAPMPVFKDVTNPVKTLTDLYKAKFFRRSWYRAKKQTRMAKLPLTGGDLQELLSFLDRYPVGARLFLNGIDQDGKMVASS
jgi:hypothetical protein